jgi:hypothetical protein
MYFKARIWKQDAGCAKTVRLFLGEKIVASAPFTRWGGVGKITLHDEEDPINKKNRVNIVRFLKAWGKSAVKARLDYAKDEAELKGEI